MELSKTPPGSATKLDASGFIRKTASAQNICPPYDAVVQSAISELRASGLSVHSIYLYGSVAEGIAKPPKSDLDLTVVLHGAIAEKERTILHKIQKGLEETYPEVSSVDLPAVSLDEVRKPQSYYGWGYWFAVCCCCVDGDDLGNAFGPYRPSWQLAHGLNGDLEEVLLNYKAELSNSETDVQLLCRGAARKILRSAFCLIMAKENSPIPPLLELKDALTRNFPDQVKGFDLALELATRPLNDSDAVQQMLDSVGAWVVEQFRTAPRQ